MSDTPRTDEQINGKSCTRFEVLAGDSLRNASVPSEFTRQLERELNEANDRIKRLEEAGDAMASILNNTRKDWYTSDQCEVTAFTWNEAKEAKP